MKILLLHGMNTDESKSWETSLKNIITKNLKERVPSIKLYFSKIDFNKSFGLNGQNDSFNVFLYGAGKTKEKDETSEFFLNEIKRIKPDIIFAHSLGSLILFYGLSNRLDIIPNTILNNIKLVTFGSQIANPNVAGAYSNTNSKNWDFNPENIIKNWFNIFNLKDQLDLWIMSIFTEHAFWVEDFSRYNTVRYLFKANNFKQITISTNTNNSPHSFESYFDVDKLDFFWNNLAT